MIEDQISPINTPSKGRMHDSYKTKKTLKIGKKAYIFNSLKLAEKNGLKNISSLPFSIKILLENLTRNEDGVTAVSYTHLTLPTKLSV